MIKSTLDNVTRSELHVRKTIERYLDKIAAVPLSNGASKYLFELKGVPGPTMLVDSFPVRCRGDKNAVNGKYKCKVARFQGLADLAGNAIGCLKMTSTIHDNKFYQENGVGVSCVEGECVIGDLAYIGLKDDSCTHPPILTASKQSSKKSPDLISERVKKYLQIIRSPIERLFSRLHVWGILKFSRTSPVNTAKFIHLVILADAIQNPQRPNPDLVTTHTHSIPPTKPVGETAYARAMAAIRHVVSDTNLRLQGRNSKRRGKNAPSHKYSYAEFGEWDQEMVDAAHRLKCQEKEEKKKKKGQNPQPPTQPAAPVVANRVKQPIQAAKK